jgi:hypothetical protein
MLESFWACGKIYVQIPFNIDFVRSRIILFFFPFVAEFVSVLANGDLHLFGTIGFHVPMQGNGSNKGHVWYPGPEPWLTGGVVRAHP